jgi:DNA-binding IclR family transcriptional regulator
MAGPPGRDTVLGKTMLVLRAFTSEDRALSLAELGRRTGLTKSTLHRLCTDLVGTGLLERTADRYRLGRLVFELGMRATAERDLLEAATPHLEGLRTAVRETVHLGVRDGVEVVYVAKLAARHEARTPSRAGGRLGLHCTAVGKALLAFSPPQVLDDVVVAGLSRRTARTLVAPGLLAEQLAKVRAEGVAFEFEESTPGIVCVGAPVFGPDHEVVAAVSVAGPASRFRPRNEAARVVMTARVISAAYSHRLLGTPPATYHSVARPD